MSHRRYRVGENPVYDTTFDRLKSTSIILNKKGAQQDRHPNTFGVLTSMTSREGLKGLLHTYLGDELGNVKLSDSIYSGKAIKPKAAQDIARLKARFIKRNDARRRSGKPELDWNEMPADTREEMLRAEARYDIVCEEVDQLQKLLDGFVEKEVKVEESKILQYGLRGDSHTGPNGFPVIDGMKTSLNIKGKLFFNDPRSPYNGLLTEVYHKKLIPAWNKAVEEKIAEIRAEAAKRGIKLPPFDQSISNAWRSVPFPPCPKIEKTELVETAPEPEEKREAVPVAKGA